jgi:hypothetical protein
VDGKPNRDRFPGSGFDPMPAVSSDHQPIAGRKVNLLYRIEKRDLSRALHHSDPFIRWLVKPEIGWRNLAGRNDALDAE